MTTISNRQPEVKVSYTCPACKGTELNSKGQPCKPCTLGRITKHFTNAYAARRWYVRQHKLGNKPQVHRSETMSEVSRDFSDEPVEVTSEVVTGPPNVAAEMSTGAKKATARSKKSKASKSKKETSSKKATKPSTKKAPKKVSSKATAKKAVKKSTKSSPKKSTKKDIPPKKKAPTIEGLTKNQVKVLSALKGTNSNKEMSRPQISKATGITKGFSHILGAVTIEDYGVSENSGLEPMGLVKSAQYEDSRNLHYHITSKGIAKLAKLS